ncbi:hypothetical protein ACWDTI_17520 [Gordonia sp. NPDC003424]
MTGSTSRVLSPAVLTLFAAVVLLLFSGCHAEVSVGGDSNAIKSPSDVKSGECLQIGDKTDKDGKVVATKTECDVSGLTFTVVGTVPTGEQCTSENFSSLSFDGESEKICMAPNFAEGKCYQVPAGEGATIVDYREVDCSATPTKGTVIYRVTSSTAGSATCPEKELAVDLPLPEPHAYCVQKVSQG